MSVNPCSNKLELPVSYPLMPVSIAASAPAGKKIDHTHHLLIHELTQGLRQKEHQVAIYAVKGTTYDFRIVNYTRLYIQ